MIVQLIKQYPKFIPMYREIYELCRNVEKVMGLFQRLQYWIEYRAVHDRSNVGYDR